SGYCVSRVLSSFPTRRSSDLEGVDLPAEGVAPDGHVDPADRLLALGAVHDAVRQHDHAGAGAVGGHARLDPLAQRLQQLERARQDRKSTRLNSSHVKISYTVF